MGQEGRDVRKIVTAVFADVMGSTSLREQLDPERSSGRREALKHACGICSQTWCGAI
jgi:class 3 adenylate cyclase